MLPRQYRKTCPTFSQKTAETEIKKMEKRYEIKRICGEIDWQSVPALELGAAYLDTPATTSAFAQICYNEETIFVHLRTKECETRAEEKGALGEPYHDSCLEFFFSPLSDGRYFNIELNSNKCLYLGFGVGKNKGARLIVDVDETLAPKVNKTEDGWEIFYRIPVAFIRMFTPEFSAKPGVSFRANCYKCADMMTPAHYLSWSRVNTEPLSFHCPECFGTMVFGD